MASSSVQLARPLPGIEVADGERVVSVNVEVTRSPMSLVFGGVAEAEAEVIAAIEDRVSELVEVADALEIVIEDVEDTVEAVRERHLNMKPQIHRCNTEYLT